MFKQRRILTTSIWIILLVSIVSGIYLNWMGLKLAFSHSWKVWITSKWAIVGFINTAIFVLSLLALESLGRERKG